MFETKHKIRRWEEIPRLRAYWSFLQQRVVFTNGCFDIVHLGHVEYLEAASRLGDVLVVGLNSDASVRRLKGSRRPILPEEARARLLAAMEFVEAVFVFEEDTPERLIEALRPDVLVKGGDYTEDQIAGASLVRAYGGEVVILPYIEGYSTTGLIQKLCNG